MEARTQKRLTRVGVFYDGNYLLHVSNYYNYVHTRRSRISINGLHEFICHTIAAEENTDPRVCKIVDAHYFRGRLSAQEASQRGNQMYYDRVFDDILMSEGVVTHYLPIKTFSGYKLEKGIEVTMSLEAFELALHKQFDVVVLIASDGDYTTLVKKLNALGIRLMVLSWEFEYTNDEGIKVTTKTSQDLMEMVSYPVLMHHIIDSEERAEDSLVNNLFVKPVLSRPIFEPGEYEAVEGDGEYRTSQVQALKNGYGFIKFPPNNLFFHYTSLIETDFNDLMEGDYVEFTIETNEIGEPIAKNVRLMGQDEFVPAADTVEE